MAMQSILVILGVLALKIFGTCGAESQPIELCSTSFVDVTGSLGVIRYNGGTAFNCNLYLRDLQDDWEVTFTSKETSSLLACPLRVSLTINSENFCPRYGESVKVKVLGRQITIRLTGNSNMLSIPSFSITYKISRPARCGDVVVANPAGNEAGEFTMNKELYTGRQCIWQLINIPGTSAFVQFNILNWTVTGNASSLLLLIGDHQLNDSSLNSILVTGNGGGLFLSIDADENEPPWSVTYSYRVIVCQDPPPLANGYYDSSQLPALNGTAVEYFCNNGYELKNRNANKRSCKFQQDILYWTDTEDIECVPVRKCDELPPAEEGTEMRLANEFLAEYSCVEGYEEAPGSSKLVSECLSTNNELYKWTPLRGVLICLPEEKDEEDDKEEERPVLLPSCGEIDVTSGGFCAEADLLPNCCKLDEGTKWKSVAIAFIAITSVLIAVAIGMAVVVFLRPRFRRGCQESNHQAATDMSTPNTGDQNPGLNSPQQLAGILNDSASNAQPSTSSNSATPQRALLPPTKAIYLNCLNLEQPEHVYVNSQGTGGHVAFDPGYERVTAGALKPSKK